MLFFGIKVVLQYRIKIVEILFHFFFRGTRYQLERVDLWQVHEANGQDG